MSCPYQADPDLCSSRISKLVIADSTLAAFDPVVHVTMTLPELTTDCVSEISGPELESLPEFPIVPATATIAPMARKTTRASSRFRFLFSGDGGPGGGGGLAGGRPPALELVPGLGVLAASCSLGSPSAASPSRMASLNWNLRTSSSAACCSSWSFLARCSASRRSSSCCLRSSSIRCSAAALSAATF